MTILSAWPASAARYALLAGVSRYAQGIGPLEGPQHDVESLRRLLVDSWGFPKENVTVLLNAAASRDVILGTLERLASSVKKGDFVFQIRVHGFPLPEIKAKEKILAVDVLAKL